MKIDLETLSILNYDKSDKQYKFAQELSNDEMISRYVPCNVKAFILGSQEDDDLRVSSAYIIADKNKLIGFIHIFSSFNKLYTLNYGVHPNYRNQGYGTKILKEVSDYTLSEKNKGVRISISKTNEYSIKAALAAGYELEDVISEVNYVYEKRK